MAPPSVTPPYHAQALQQDIARALLRPDAPYAESLDAAVRQSKISTGARLEIYKNNVVGGLIEVVLARYPTIIPLVGDEFARAMAREYVLKNPPPSANMNEYAADYPAFIRGFTPAQNVAFLPDIAVLEGLEHQAYYAPDGAVLNLDNAAKLLPQIMAGAAKLDVHPSCGFMCSAYPLLSLQKFALTDDAAVQDFDLDAGGQHIMVWRLGFRVESLVIDAAAYVFFGTLQETQDVNHAFEAAIQCNATFDFETFLQNMMMRDAFIIG
jgi:hypothetical protein|tara:strand:+ start:143286 stop:144086 length:801 start_codon:yes stop_codon:yes gene_type:complete